MAACFFSIQNRDTVVCSKKEERLYQGRSQYGKNPDRDFGAGRILCIL